MIKPLVIRPLFHGCVAAGVAVAVNQGLPLLHRAFKPGLNLLPSAGLGIISGIFYSATFDLLASHTHFHPIAIHAISILTSAIATYSIALAAAAAGIIAMPSLATLGAVVAAATIANFVIRLIFKGPYPSKPILPANVQLHPPRQRVPIWPVVAPAINPKSDPNLNRSWAAGPAASPSQWSWPADLNTIALSEASKKEIEAFLNEVVPQIVASKQMPAFHRRGEEFVLNGKSWKLPRTLTFIADPNTKQLAGILLNVSSKRVGILGKGGQRTVKKCYNLTTGEMVVKKGAASPYEVELLKSLNGTKGFEALSYVRVIPDKRRAGRIKTHLITPIATGSLDKLLAGSPKLQAKEIRDLMLPLFQGMEKLHAHPGRTSFPGGMKVPSYKSYHLDIKPENLLYKKTPQGYEACVSDVGTVNDIPYVWYTRGWLSPEKARELHNGDAVKFLTQHGQHDDIWNMALVLTCLLKGSSTHALSSCYQPDTLKQREVDGHLASHRKMAKNRNAALWEIARKMLQVDPAKRLTMHQAREELEKMVV